MNTGKKKRKGKLEIPSCRIPPSLSSLQKNNRLRKLQTILDEEPMDNTEIVPTTPKHKPEVSVPTVNPQNSSSAAVQAVLTRKRKMTLPAESDPSLQSLKDRLMMLKAKDDKLKAKRIE